MKMNDDEFDELYEKYENSKFRQQKMSGKRPMPTISCVTVIFVSIGVFFILMGIIMLIFTAIIYEIKERFDDQCHGVKAEKNCTIEVSIKKNMKKPIEFYMQIEDITPNLKDNKYYKDDGHTEMKEDDFNYTFTIASLSGYLIGKQFKGVREYNDWKDHSRIKPFSNPRFYLGNIAKGEHNPDYPDFEASKKIRIDIYTNVSIYKEDNIKRYIIITETNAFGGKNWVLGIFYLVFGLLCLIASIIFINAFNNFHKKV